MSNKVNVQKKFFVFNPKSYLTGEELYKLAMKANDLANEIQDISIFVTAPYADLNKINEVTNNIILTSQHLDGIDKGRGMGHVLPDSLINAGVQATFLNHAERPLSLSELISSIEKADELGILTIVCADSLTEAKLIAHLNPDIILCEPTELIGTGKTSDESYVIETNQAVKNISPDTLVMQAAGISNEKDVYDVIKLGADGTGCTSGIVKADDPVSMLEKMVKAVDEANRED